MKKYLFILPIIIIITIYIHLKNNKNYLYQKNILVINTQSISPVNKIEDKNTNYYIDIYYPNTIYQNLNKYIEDNLHIYINNFIKETKENKNIPYSEFKLIITYKEYTYNNYLSYLFHIFIDTRGAHPNTYIFTANYDKKTNKIIDINYLTKNYKNILNIFSEISRKTLEDKKLKIPKDMLLEGTTPKKENFKNFIFSNSGIILLFERYSVAPYSYGEFNVKIPYQSLQK